MLLKKQIVWKVPFQFPLSVEKAHFRVCHMLKLSWKFHFLVQFYTSNQEGSYMRVQVSKSVLFFDYCDLIVCFHTFPHNFNLILFRI